MSIIANRQTAVHEGPMVVFIIGMRINKLWMIWKWLPVFRAMGTMLNELYRNPESGFLHTEVCWRGPRMPVLIQYWRDFNALESYARSRDQQHWPAWVTFNKAIGGNGTVGIFHETYCVEKDAHETIYGNMPLFGLGKVAGVTPATGSRNEARQRLRASGDSISE